jgi:hypothetical protein
MTTTIPGDPLPTSPFTVTLNPGEWLSYSVPIHLNQPIEITAAQAAGVDIVVEIWWDYVSDYSDPGDIWLSGKSISEVCYDAGTYPLRVYAKPGSAPGGSVTITHSLDPVVFGDPLPASPFSIDFTQPGERLYHFDLEYLQDIFVVMDDIAAENGSFAVLLFPPDTYEFVWANRIDQGSRPDAGLPFELGFESRLAGTYYLQFVCDDGYGTVDITHDIPVTEPPVWQPDLTGPGVASFPYRHVVPMWEEWLPLEYLESGVWVTLPEVLDEMGSPIPLGAYTLQRRTLGGEWADYFGADMTQPRGWLDKDCADYHQYRCKLLIGGNTYYTAASAPANGCGAVGVLKTQIGTGKQGVELSWESHSLNAGFSFFDPNNGNLEGWNGHKEVNGQVVLADHLVKEPERFNYYPQNWITRSTYQCVHHLTPWESAGVLLPNFLRLQWLSPDAGWVECPFGWGFDDTTIQPADLEDPNSGTDHYGVGKLVVNDPDFFRLGEINYYRITWNFLTEAEGEHPWDEAVVAVIVGEPRVFRHIDKSAVTTLWLVKPDQSRVILRNEQ